MAQLGDGLNGYLDVQDATLRAPRLEAVSNIGIANTAPEHALAVGSNFYVSTESSDVLTVDGNVVCEGVKVGLIEITPSYDLAAVSNVGNSTSNTIQFTNPGTGIVTTGNVTVGKTLTVEGFRITAQAEANDDLQAITLAGADTNQVISITNATDSTGPYTGALQIGTNTGNYGGVGVAGNVHVGRGVYTQDLDVGGDAIIRGDLSVLGTTTTIDTDNLRVQDPIIELGKGNAASPVVDLGLVMTRPSGSSNVAVIFDESSDTLEIGYTEGSASDAAIAMDTAPLSVNVNGNLSVSSNVEVGTANLFVDTVNSRVGIGTTEPSGQLELVGDSTTQEYPPRALTGYETLVEGHGVFKVEGDTFYTPTNPDLDPWRAFDDNISGNNRWRQANSQFTAGGGPIDNRRYAEGLPNASWLVLHLPYDINLNGYSICPQGGQSPENIQIWGSNNGGTSWSHLHTQTQTEGDNTTYQNYTISHEGYYSIIAYLILTLTPSTATEASIRDMKYFGTPGPTTLDKGSLSLTRSLDVPRISRYDVDTETPRPEKLILDLDTTVNSSPTDISGKGNHGILNGNANYSAADKAFTGFPSSNSNYIRGNLAGVSGAYAHTQSYWINGADTTPRCPFTVGKEDGNYSYLNIWLTTSQWTLNADGAAGGVWAETIYDNRWYHVVLTYDGGTSTDSYKLYIDGEYKTPTTAISINAPLALPSNPEYRIGRNDGTQWYNGMVSNPKVYSVALEPSEVKKLYRLGRTGRSMVISDTAVGIGKVPEAQLDVRGVLKASIGLFPDKPFFVCPVARYGLKVFANPTYVKWYSSPSVLSTYTLTAAKRWLLATAPEENVMYGTRNVKLVSILNDTASETSGVQVPYKGKYLLNHLCRNNNTNAGTTFLIYSQKLNEYIIVSANNTVIPYGGNTGTSAQYNGVQTVVHLDEGDIVSFMFRYDPNTVGSYEQMVSLVML
jgi:hypothetical protein